LARAQRNSKGHALTQASFWACPLEISDEALLDSLMLIENGYLTRAAKKSIQIR
jgi:hypothetical protein